MSSGCQGPFIKQEFRTLIQLYFKKGLYNILKNDLVAILISKKKSSLFKPIVVKFLEPGN